MIWVFAVAVLVIIGFLLEREIYFYEGVHLGPRLQAWLYDRWSKKYDEGKRESQQHDDEMLAQPLVEALREVSEPFILDFATGTGRLSYALLNRPEFKAQIIALDLSQGMLEQAVAKLSGLDTSRRGLSSTESLPRPGATARPADASVEFLRHPALPLPFPDEAFDAVCALEVLELFPGMDDPLRELVRVLRPGGVLLTSRGTEESGRKAKVKPAGEFTALLEAMGLEQVQISKWWKYFDRVFATKRGSSQPVGTGSLSEILRCSNCQSIQWRKTSGHWTCQTCGRKLPVTKEGIVLT